MTAYGALISLENTIQNMLKSHRSSSVRTILKAAYSEVQPLQKILKRLDGSSKRKSRKKVNALDGRMKQKLWDFEDFLESLPSHGIKRGRIVRDAADSLINSLKDMMEEYIYEVDNMPEDDDDDDDEGEAGISSRGKNKSKMVGLSDVFKEVRHYIYRRRYCSITSYAIIGMAGLGKTTLARKVYEDHLIQSYFDCRVWIRMGRKYDSDQAVSLATLMKDGERCLIVLDDVWETGVLPIFLASLMEVKDGRFIRILITTRGRNVIRDFNKSVEALLDTSKRVDNDRVLRFMNDDESKDLLCVKVFGEEEICPTELDKAAAKIAKNCEGLPLMILTVAKRLLNNRDSDYWNEVAEERNSVFTDSYDEISKKSSDWILTDGTDMLKNCRLHSSWRYLCRREARKNKFFHVLNKLVDASPHSQEEDEDVVIKGQRGLCLENNLLFSLKDFCSSVKSYCASSTRSLFFFGPYHQYPTPLVDFKLLRELDALQLRFYTFPMQILTLFQLKYLALTCNDQLPTTISKLSKLQTLIMHPHLDLNIIKCHTPPSFIPIEIWDMLELEHIEISGKSIRASDKANACLKKLLTLIGVNADIVTISRLSKRIPNIKKLGIQMEMAPYANTSSSLDPIFSCFYRISTHKNLKTLKCGITNPVHVPLARCPVAPPRSLTLPHSLIKLHLSGMGFPWEYMMDANIASLPYLEVLKLRCHAFRGPKWEIQEGSFLQLEYLAIEDSDLAEWKPSSGSFPELNYLSLKHCYKLRELEWSHDIEYAKIELVDCNPLAVACANQLPSKASDNQYLEVFASDTYQA